MWVLVSLLAPLLLALVHIFDGHFIGNVFERPWMATIISSIASTIVFFTIPIFLPLAGNTWPEISIIGIGILTGILVQANQTLYFQTLAHAEAGIVATYWALSPIILPLMNFLIFGEILSYFSYIGIVCLVASSLIISLSDSNLEKRWKSFSLGLTGALISVLEYLLMEKVFNHTSFYIGFIIINIGVVFGGLLPLAIKEARTVFRRNIHALHGITKIFLMLEIINLIAYAAMEYGVKYGNSSVVAAIEGTTPGFTFLLSIIIYLFISKKIGGFHALNNLSLKFFGIVLMMSGIWLVS